VIFFKNSMFELDCVSQMEFKIDRVGILDRDNVGLVCRLAPRAAPNSPLVVATTHLLYNPKRDDIRLAQTALLLAEVDRLATPPLEAADRSYLPVLLTGDLNSDPASAVLQLLANGSVRYQGLRQGRGRRMPDKLLPDSLGLSDSCQWQVKLEQRGRGPEFKVGSGGFHHGFGLRSAYPPGPGVSTFQDEWTLVDYLFHSGSPRLQLAARVKLPGPAELRGRCLPGLPCPSDHLPLVADYLLSP
jgi:protein angel